LEAVLDKVRYLAIPLVVVVVVLAEKLVLQLMELEVILGIINLSQLDMVLVELEQLLLVAAYILQVVMVMPLNMVGVPVRLRAGMDH
jgi:hypothetical protein